MHLVIYFCGTGDSGDGFPDQYDYVNKDAGVRTILVKGCDEPEVCNSGLFPDLKGFAHRFVSTLIERDGNTLKLKVGKTSDPQKEDPEDTPENRILKGLGIRLDCTDRCGQCRRKN